MKNILVVMPFNEEHKAYFNAIAEGCSVSYIRADAVTEADVAAADIIVGNVAPSLLKHVKRLQWLQLNSAGYDNFCAPGIMPENALLTCATGAYGLSVSDGMITMTMMLCRKADLYMKNQHDRIWRKEGAVTTPWGATTLIVGLGDIGGEYARRMKALGSTVIGLRRNVAHKPDYLDGLYTMDHLDELLPSADIVALVLPSSPATHHLMNEERLLRMKKGSYLINAGRGDAVDCDALDRVLRSGASLAGSALDVTDPEPLPPEHPLWDAPRSIIFPHAAGNFFLPETVNRIVRIAGENLQRFLAGEKDAMRNLIDLKSGNRRT